MQSVIKLLMGNSNEIPNSSPNAELVTYEQLLRMGFDASLSWKAVQKKGHEINGCIKYIQKHKALQENKEEAAMRKLNAKRQELEDARRELEKEQQRRAEEAKQKERQPQIEDEKYEQKEVAHEQIMHHNVIDTKGKYNELEKEVMHHNIIDTKSNIVEQQNDNKMKLNEMKEAISWNESVRKQFYNFLKGMSMEKYMDKFKENDCCDMESIEFYDDDFLKNDIGIKNKIARKKFLAKCAKIKLEMNAFKNEFGITSILSSRLAKYGIVTIDILCDEIKYKNDLKYKYKITNESQCNLLWNLIQLQENPNHNFTEINAIEGQ